MTKKKQPPYNNRLSILFWISVIVGLMAFSSCATYKKDCRGNWHTKQRGGFYL